MNQAQVIPAVHVNGDDIDRLPDSVESDVLVGLIVLRLPDHRLAVRRQAPAPEAHGRIAVENGLIGIERGSETDILAGEGDRILHVAFRLSVPESSLEGTSVGVKSDQGLSAVDIHGADRHGAASVSGTGPDGRRSPAQARHRTGLIDQRCRLIIALPGDVFCQGILRQDRSHKEMCGLPDLQVQGRLVQSDGLYLDIPPVRIQCAGIIDVDPAVHYFDILGTV